MERLFASLAVPRKRTYVEAAQGDSALAVDLYLWNSQLSAAFHEVLGHVECHVRQAMDAVLRPWNARQQQSRFGEGTIPSENWALPNRAASPLRAIVQEKVRESAKRARRSVGRHRLTHDDIVAQLSFGTWVQLIPRPNGNDQKRRLIWDQALCQAFPNAPAANAGAVWHPLNRLLKLRNRIAHHENLLAVDPDARMDDALRVMAYVDQTLADETAEVSRVRDVTSQDPRRVIRTGGPETVLRPMLRSDASFLAELVRVACLGDAPELTVRQVLDSPELAAYSRLNPRAGDYGIICSHREATVGGAWMQFRAVEQPGYGFVEPGIPELSVAIVDGFRGCGLGTELIRAILTEARRRGVRQVSLSVAPGNPATDLYRRFGFLPLPGQAGGRTWLLRLDNGGDGQTEEPPD